MTKWLCICLILFFSLSATAADLSRQVSISNIPKLNRDVVLSKGDFEKQTKSVTDIPLNNTFLSYKIRLPLSWTLLKNSSEDRQIDLSKRILGNVVEYLGPPTLDLRSSFRIRANDLTYDISAKDWFLSYVFSNGYSLEGMDVTSEKRIQAQYVMVSNGYQFRVRAVAEISGPRIILAEYIVPIDFWDREKDVAKYSMAGFLLTNPDPAPIEVMQNFSFVDIAQFNYPASWVLSAPPITAIDRMNANLINYRGNLADTKLQHGSDVKILIDGKIDISIVAKLPDVKIEKEIALMKNDLLAKQLVLGDLIERVEGWSRNDAMSIGRIEAYKINNVQQKLTGYEQWVGVFETPSRYYFVRLLTISRQDDFLTWARNIKAYKMVISSLSPIK